MEAAFVVTILLFSIILHEVSHGVVALWNGDDTALKAGRLTLNPLPHIDPLGSVILPAILYFSHSGILFGWARPVPFDPRNFRDRKFGVFTVGVAGPVTNLLLAIAFTALFRLVPVTEFARTVFLCGASMNLALAIFNMLPIPPLDGSRAVAPLLPAWLRRAYLSLEPWGFVIIAALLFTGTLKRIVEPVFLRLLFWMMGHSIEV